MAENGHLPRVLPYIPVDALINAVDRRRFSDVGITSFGPSRRRN